MLEQDQARELSQKVLMRCGKDPAEVVIIHMDHALTRFANNTIHQNVSELNNTIYLRRPRVRCNRYSHDAHIRQTV